MSHKEMFKERHRFQIVATIPICERDAQLFLPRLLQNLNDLGVGASWYCDNLFQESLREIRESDRTVGMFVENNHRIRYSENHRLYPSDIAKESGAEWALRIDADETVMLRDWKVVPELISQGRKQWRGPWYNVWEDISPHPIIRVDSPLEPDRCSRIMLLPLQGVRWTFRHPIASAYSDVDVPEDRCDIRVIHWGFSTKELRQDHRERWDRLYRPNPYQLWNEVCDESKSPVLFPLDPSLSHAEWIENMKNKEMSR